MARAVVSFHLSSAVLVLLCLVILETLPAITAAPLTSASASNLLSRVKRVSDQRLAELETMVALHRKPHGKLVTVPLGFGKLDPKLLGRRRRSDYSSPSLQEAPPELNRGEYEDYELLQFLLPEEKH